MIQVADEHEFEAAHGLPERLPCDEHILWQGSPQWRTLARHAFHLRKLAVYFAVILGLRAGNVLLDGGSALQALESALWLTPLALAALGLLAAIAWLTARAAVYTITNRRLVMRLGVVLTVTFNIPFRMIESVGLHSFANGGGDIPLTLLGTDRIAYLQLWPHVRPWRFKQTEPMLCAVPAAANVGNILAQAIVANSGGAAQAAVAGPVPAESGENQAHRRELASAI
jgi:hypothetical protein